MNDLKITLKAARVNAGLTQGDLASLLNVDITTVLRWERGETEPKISQLRKISEVSGIPIQFIVLPCKS